MKVLAFNGSPRTNGNTFHALQMVTDQLAEEGIETKIVQVGDKAVHGCTVCGKCRENQDEMCVLPEDGVNEGNRGHFQKCHCGELVMGPLFNLNTCSNQFLRG